MRECESWTNCIFALLTTRDILGVENSVEERAGM